MLPVVGLILVFAQAERSVSAQLCLLLSVCVPAFLDGWPLLCPTHSVGNHLNDRHLMWVANKQTRCAYFSLNILFPLAKAPLSSRVFCMRCSHSIVPFLITLVNA